MFCINFVTSADHDAYCGDRLDIPIQLDDWAKVQHFAAAKSAAALQQLPIRGVHAIRKPKDMLISAYCYHHRGEELSLPLSPYPTAEVMSMGPLEGFLALWPTMSAGVQDMVDVYTNTRADEMFHVRFEEITKSSEAFDDVVQRLFPFGILGNMF